MKKVCFITTIHNTLFRFILPFAKYIHENSDWDITFICKEDNSFEDSLPSFIHFIPVKMERGASLNGFSATRDLIRIFNTEKFDLIQYSTPNASCYAALAGWITRVPIRLYCQWGLVFEGFCGVKRLALMALERMTCKLSSWVEPDSKGNLDYCRSLGFYKDDKSSVILYGSACGVSFEKFDIKKKTQFRKEARAKFCIPEDAFVFGFAGSVCGDKGINELMAASRALISKYTDIFVTVFGMFEKSYSLDKELLQWAKNEQRFVFGGQSEEIEKNMAAMDCYVTASYREGFGTTVIEAGAMGLPVITSNIPGPTDVIKNQINGLVVEKKNVNELIQAMVIMHDDYDLRMRLGNNGYEIVKERYDQELVFKAMYEDRKRLLSHCF